MHTFFINTSEKISEKLKDGIYQDILFEELTAKKALIIPNIYTQTDTDSLKKCAQSIAARIDQEADVDESIALIVYMESGEVSPGSPDYLSAHMIAEEILKSLQAEEALVRTLCSQGKHPQKLVFIFGEHVKRDPTLTDDKVFLENIKKELWELLCLPSSKKTLPFLGEEPAGESNSSTGKLPEAEELKQFFTDNLSNLNYFLTDTDSLSSGVLDDLVRSILARARKLRRNLSGSDLYASLDDVLNEFMNNRLRDRVNGFYADSVTYNYIPLEFKDIHENDQSICRLMLNVYAMANNFNVGQKEMIPLCEESTDVLNASILPQVNYPVLKQSLNVLADRCRRGVYTSAKAPAAMSQSLENKDQLITSSHKAPHFTVEKLIDGDSFYKKSRLQRIFTSIPKLRAAVENVLNNAISNNEKNRREFIEYINRTSSEYDRIKDDALKNLSYTDDLPEIPDPNSEDAEKRIDDMKNIEYKVDSLITERELRFLKAPMEPSDPKDVQDLIERTRKQSDYYFEGLQHRLLAFSGGIIFVVLFLIPYYFIKRDIFAISNGQYIYSNARNFFWGTGLICAVTYLVGYFHFTSSYKDEIYRLMEGFVSSFNRIQTSNNTMLKEYQDMLYRDIPEYYAICKYDAYLKQFKELSTERREKITFHEKSRKDRIEKIKSLLDDLDSAKSGELPADMRESNSKSKWEINPDGDRIANRGTYILSSRDVRKSLAYEEKKADDGAVKNE